MPITFPHQCHFHAKFSFIPRSFPCRSHFHANVISMQMSFPCQGQFHAKVNSTPRSVLAKIICMPRSFTKCHGQVCLNVSYTPWPVPCQSQFQAKIFAKVSYTPWSVKHKVLVNDEYLATLSNHPTFEK